MPRYSPSSNLGATSNSALNVIGSPALKLTSVTLGWPTTSQMFLLQPRLGRIAGPVFRSRPAGCRRRTLLDQAERAPCRDGIRAVLPSLNLGDGALGFLFDFGDGNGDFDRMLATFN